MNRIIRVSRTADPLFSVRIEIFDGDKGRNYEDNRVGPPAAVLFCPLSVLTLTPAEASELENILKMFSYNDWLSSMTGSGGWREATFVPPKSKSAPVPEPRCGVPLAVGGFCMEPATPGCCYCDTHAAWPRGDK